MHQKIRIIESAFSSKMLPYNNSLSAALRGVFSSLQCNESLVARINTPSKTFPCSFIINLCAKHNYNALMFSVLCFFTGWRLFCALHLRRWFGQASRNKVRLFHPAKANAKKMPCHTGTRNSPGGLRCRSVSSLFKRSCQMCAGGWWNSHSKLNEVLEPLPALGDEFFRCALSQSTSWVDVDSLIQSKHLEWGRQQRLNHKKNSHWVDVDIYDFVAYRQTLFSLR